MSAPPVLETAGLGAAYGQARILFEITIEVAAGEIVSLLGRNGAGKSTTLKSVIGLVPHRSGAIRLMGEDIIREPPYRVARRGVGYVPEERRVFAGLTVLENLEVGRRPSPGSRAWTPERLFDLFPNLAELRHRHANRISGGEQQMLAIARTLMGDPRLLLLDEPSEGLAPVIVAQMARAVRELRASGVAVLLAEQSLRFAAAVADRAYVLEKGRLVHQGPMAELMAHGPRRTALLGL